MLTMTERKVVEAVKRSPTITIRIDGADITIKSRSFSHDVGLMIQKHFNDAHRHEKNQNI